MVRQFKDLKKMQEYMEVSFPTILFNDKKFESVLRNTMRQAVQDVVYKSYTPEMYDRREDNNGLSDTRLMQITDAMVTNGNLHIIFQNLAKGNDSLSGQYLAETIENGIRKNWDNPDTTDKQGRKPSVPRPFVQETMNMIKANPQPLVEAVKDAFRKVGFKVAN